MCVVSVVLHVEYPATVSQVITDGLFPFHFVKRLSMSTVKLTRPVKDVAAELRSLEMNEFFVEELLKFSESLRILFWSLPVLVKCTIYEDSS